MMVGIRYEVDALGCAKVSKSGSFDTTVNLWMMMMDNCSCGRVAAGFCGGASMLCSPKIQRPGQGGQRLVACLMQSFMQVPNKCRTSAKTQAIDSCFRYRANPVKHKTGLFEWALCFQLAH